MSADKIPMQGLVDARPIWEDPPPPASKSTRTASSVFDELRKRPGRWARISVTRHRNNTLTSRYPEFEFATRKVADGKFGVWARYVGNGKS